MIIMVMIAMIVIANLMLLMATAAMAVLTKMKIVTKIVTNIEVNVVNVRNENGSL